MRIAFYESAQDNVPRVEDLDWPKLVETLTTFRRSHCPTQPCEGKCPAKNGPAWSPVDIVEKRRNENVRGITVAVFDLDHLKPEQLAAVDDLEAAGYAFAYHSTHSNKMPSDCNFRLIMPLTRTVLPREWATVREAAVRTLKLPADPATRDLARLYYLPDAPEGTEPISGSHAGRPLDVDALLTGAKPAAIPLSLPEPSQAGSDGIPVDVHEIADALRKHVRPENRLLINRVLKGEAFAAAGARDDTLQRLMSTIAFVLPDSTPDEAVLHLLRPSFAATPAEEAWGDAIAHLNKIALQKMHRARERRQERDAQRLAENQAICERLGLVARKSARDLAPLDEDAEEDPEQWQSKFVTYMKRDEVRLLTCEANIHAVLSHSPQWKGVVRFNEVTKEIEVHGGPLAPDSRVDELDAAIAIWLQKSEYGELGLRPNRRAVADVLRMVAYQNSRDPIRDYLTGVEWDGTSRIDTLLEKLFGAEGDPSYLRMISRKWMISSVARALRPGCKVDTVLMLEGPQGLGKSSAIKALFGQWACDSKLDIGNKDTAALAAQNWGIELAELDALKKASDVEQLKAFLTRAEDQYRPPFGRVNVRSPRRCVFIGTTNADEYLRHDPSGYRRFWPVKCQRIDVDTLRTMRDQLWAEAVMLFERGERWWLEDNETKLAEAQAVERSEISAGYEQTLLEWLLKRPADKRTDLTTEAIAVDALELSPGQVTRAIRMEVGKALRVLGFRRVNRRVAGAQTWVYMAPDEIRSAPMTIAGQRPSHVAAVA